MPSLESNQLVLTAADACDSKKAEDIRILALDPTESGLSDYFLICTGTNERQNVAISDEIEYRLKTEFNTYPNSVEGRRQGEWVLMDYVDFVVHIFLPEKRAYYGLERLRKTAKTITIAELNSEIKAAIAKTRAKKTPAKKAVAAKSTVKKTAAKKPLAVKKAAAKTAPRKSTAAKKSLTVKTTKAKTKVASTKAVPGAKKK